MSPGRGTNGRLSWRERMVSENRAPYGSAHKARRAVLRDHIHLVWRMLRVGWQARRLSVVGFFAGAVVEISCFIFTMYAGAKLAGLLAGHASGDRDAGPVWLWMWLGLASGAGCVLGGWMMSTFKRLLYYTIAQWSIRNFHRALADLDIPDFYDEQARDRINKARDGYAWQVSGFCDATLDLG